MTVGTLGLLLHCSATSNRVLLDAIPSTGSYIAAVNSLGAVRIGLYAVSAFLLVAGLRRQQQIALWLLTASLVAIGVTMYNHGPLVVRLTAILTGTTLLAATVTLLVCGLR